MDTREQVLFSALWHDTKLEQAIRNAYCRGAETWKERVQTLREVLENGDIYTVHEVDLYKVYITVVGDNRKHPPGILVLPAGWHSPAASGIKSIAVATMNMVDKGVARLERTGEVSLLRAKKEGVVLWP